MATLLLIIIYLAFISLGLPDALLGSAWPTMQGAFGVPISYAGIVTMIVSGGTILSSLASDKLTDKLGTRIVTLISASLTALALFGFSISTEFWMLCLWAIPYGLGAGAIDAALNNYISLYYTSRHMSWLHCFWGVGTIVGPYIISSALRTSEWQVGYRTVSAIQTVIALVLLVSLPVWKVHKKTAEIDSKEEKKSDNVLKIRGVIPLLLGFFAYCAAEATVMLWASSYLFIVKDISKELAAAFGSLFFIGMTVGRFISGFISEKLGDRKLIRIGTGIAFFGILLLILPIKYDVFSLAGFVIIGLGCAPIYPSIIHSTPSNFGRVNSSAIIGIQMASAYVGSTFIPPVFGLIANHISIKLLPYYIIIFMLFSILMLEKTFNITKKDES